MTVLRVGLTGNIAAGKSTVAGWLADCGCEVINLDTLGHACLAAGTPTYEEVVRLFGEAILDADRSIDRRALAAIVFSNEDSRRRLEAILHPEIQRVEHERVERILHSGIDAVVVSEAALLYETGADERYHRMVVVIAPDDLRRTRLRERGMQADEAVRRMRSQMAQESKAQRADYVIDNSGSMQATRDATCALEKALRADLGKLIANRELGPAEPLPRTP